MSKHSSTLPPWYRSDRSSALSGKSLRPARELPNAADAEAAALAAQRYDRDRGHANVMPHAGHRGPHGHPLWPPGIYGTQESIDCYLATGELPTYETLVEARIEGF